jgi:uncharacterized protein
MPAPEPDELDPLLTEACAALPLFPLPGMVFLPHTLLPLHVFEPRYRALIVDAMAADGVLAVPQLLAAETPGAPPPPVARVVGVGRIVQHQEMPDGRSNIVLAGIGRARILAEIAGDAPYRVAMAEALAPPRPDAGLARPRLLGSLAALAQREPAVAGPVRSLLERDVVTPALCAAVAHMLLRDPRDRQAFLELEAESAQVEHLLVALSSIAAGPGPEA